MKTCPVCSETYSERIDFCFNDGEVLTLMPSAMDAPMPRLAGLGRVAVDPTAAPPPPRLPNTSTANAPAATDVPDPARARADVASAVEAPPEPRAATVVPPPRPPEPAPPAATPATPAESPAPRAERASFPHEVTANGEPARVDPPRAETPRPEPVKTDNTVARAEPPRPEVVRAEPRPAGEVRPVEQAPRVRSADKPRPRADEPTGSTPVAWFLGALMLVLALFVLGWALGFGGSPDDRTPVAELRRPDAAKAPTASEPTRPSTPGPTPVTLPAPPATVVPAIPAPATAELTPPPEVKVPDLKPPEVVEKAKAPPTTTPPTTTPAAPQVVAPTAAPASPWDAPQQAAVARTLITSDPPGAAIRVDGKSKGTTPLEIELPYGTYSVELDLDGYQPLRKRIDVQSPSPKFPITLQKEVRRGNVLVVLEGWDSATLVVDGEVRGQLPANIVLSEGPHTFVVRGERGEVKLQRVVTLSSSGLTRLLLHQ